MNVPLELSFRDDTRSDELDELIREKVDHLERICDHISSCRVSVEQPQKHMNSGSPFRVRVDITVPKGHEIVARREPGEGELHDTLPYVIRTVFDAAERQLKRVNEQQHIRQDTHEQQQAVGIVDRIFKDKGYGFIKTPSELDVYFHRNSVLNDAFDRLEQGSGVHYVAETGEKGLQATTVRLVDKPGVSRPKG